MFTVYELTRITGGKLIAGGGNIQAKGISIDSRTIKKEEIFLALKGDNFDGADYIGQAIKKGASCIIKETGKGKFKAGSCACLEVKDSVKALGDIARYHRRRFNIPVVAITGSNGKTTTKEMVSWALSKKFKVLKTEGTKNNHIGLPLTLLGLSPQHQVAIVELGTNHFGEIENLASICLPNIGLVTNIGPSHLEYFGNVQGVLKEKYALVENLSAPAVAIINADNRLLRRKLSTSGKTGLILGFGTSKYSDFRITRLERARQGIEFQVNGQRKIILPTIGAHNVYNALAAISIARILGLSYDEIAARLTHFEFPSGRLKLRKFDSAKFIDDTYNSSPASLKQALYALEDFPSFGSKIVVMGDMMELGVDKEEFHYEAGKQIARVCDKFIAVGKLSKVAANAARHSGFDTRNLFSCGCVEEARELLFNKISPKKEDVVLVKGSRAMKMEKIFEER
ncbi:MAG: UDP-N-acetylmuramoyl-tripeptide--D-alanyl-D-alanine ligase [Candidatus Omnitrophica bacterium]|nr:UDP-N-acetylmuramoyl-tripeptide--D-alanyl-D-alanine ligase [Candidatus Omnitrophota bacterium]